MKDPELHLDLVSLKMIKDVHVEGGKVRLNLELTTPACPFNSQIENDVRNAVKNISGVEDLDLRVTARVWIGRPHSEEESLPHVKNVIAVASGKGGVGKSTLAVNLALALGEMHAQVGLLDADIYGPTVPKILRMTQKPSVSGTKLTPARTHFGVRVMSVGLFLADDDPLAWRGPMISSAIKRFLVDIEWGALDYLIVDLPPGTGDASLTVAQTIPLTGVVIVSTPQEAAVTIATKALRLFRSLDIPILGVVENMTPTKCPHCGKSLDFFGSAGAKEAAKETGSFYLGEIALDERIRINGDLGNPVLIAEPESTAAQSFRSIARNVAGRVSIIAHTRMSGKPAVLA